MPMNSQYAIVRKLLGIGSEVMKPNKSRPPVDSYYEKTGKHVVSLEVQTTLQVYFHREGDPDGPPAARTRTFTSGAARTGAPNVVVETVKLAEDGEDLVVRVYEAHNQRGRVELSFGAPLAAALECNLLEEEERAVEYTGDILRFYITPYQIRTFKVRLST